MGPFSGLKIIVEDEAVATQGIACESSNVLLHNDSLAIPKHKVLAGVRNNTEYTSTFFSFHFFHAWFYFMRWLRALRCVGWLHNPMGLSQVETFH